MVFSVDRPQLVFLTLQHGLFLNHSLFWSEMEMCHTAVISRIHLLCTWETWDSMASLWPPDVCPFLLVTQTPQKWFTTALDSLELQHELHW